MVSKLFLHRCATLASKKFSAKGSALDDSPRPRASPKHDQLVRELALAAEVAYGVGPQQARDWAVALMEARPARPTKLPRGFRKAPVGSKLVGYELPRATFAGRETAIRQKIKREGGGVRRDVVVALFRLLRARDEDLVRRLQALVDALTSTVAR